MERLKKFKITFIIYSILYIILGLILIIWPQISAFTICNLFGILTLSLGIVRIIGYFTNKDFGTPFRLDFTHGALNIMIGSFMLSSPKIVIAILPVLLGIVIIIDSILRMQISIDLKRTYEKWIRIFIPSIITLIFGILLLFNPFAGSIILTIYMGICFVVDGIANLWGLTFLTKVVKDENSLFI